LGDPRLQEFVSAGRDGRGGTVRVSNKDKIRKGISETGNVADYDVCCPNC